MKQTWGAKRRRSASWWVRFPGIHVLCNQDTLSGVLSNNRTISTISTVRDLDAPATNSDALIWCASSSASKALLAASISWRSFFRARASSSARPLHILSCYQGGGGGISEVENRAGNTVSSAGSTEGASDSGTLTSKIVSISAPKTVDCILKIRHIHRRRWSG